MPQIVHAIGATAAFAAGPASLAALAVWGATAPGPTAARVALGLGLPVLAAVLWGAFAAPRARWRGPVTAAAVVLLVEGGAVAALAVLGRLLTVRAPGPPRVPAG